MTVSVLSDCNYRPRHLNTTSTRISSEKSHPHNQSHHFISDSQQQLAQQPPPMTGSGYHRSPEYSYTWLVFKEERWQPFDPRNQFILEETLSVDGTFVDIGDSLFPGVKRVRVFPRNNYLSYLGLKYRMSRVLQPDAWSWFS